MEEGVEVALAEIGKCTSRIDAKTATLLRKAMTGCRRSWTSSRSRRERADDTGSSEYHCG